MGFLCLVIWTSVIPQGLMAQTIWTGEEVLFEKEGHHDPTISENQDRITENIWLTRGNSGGLYNAKLEEKGGANSPLGTKWAYGVCEDMEYLEFKTQREMVRKCGRHIYMTGQSFCVYLEGENAYVNFKIIEWANKANGSAIRYERSSIE